MGKKYTTHNKLQSSIVSRLSSSPFQLSIANSPSSLPTTSNQQPATNSCRFTLIEMLVALALGVIILAVAVTAFQQGGAISKVSHAKTEAVHNARVALQMLERDLEQAYIEPTGEKFVGTHGYFDWNDDGVFDDDGDGYNDDDGDVLTLYSLSEQGEGAPGDPITYQLTYITDIKTSQGYELPYLERDDGFSNFSVGDGVRSFNVRYYYDDGNSATDDWYNEWNSTDPDGADGISGNDDDLQYRRLPQIVEVTIEVIDSDGVLAKKDQNPVQIRRLIELPQ
jgi:prepilin-type N-terminal cleavage/methylation domain-containing protein